MKAISTLILILLSAQSFAQLTQNIRGTVYDKHSQMTLPGATVILLGQENPVGVSTDINGKFKLENVPVGRASIQVTFIGYAPANIKNLNLTSAKELVLNIELEERVNELKEVVVEADGNKRETINQMAVVSSRKFSVEESQRYAGSLNDVARMASNYAGVSSANDQRNDIIVRGNSPTGILYRLEGVDIPNPNHFSTQGTTGGPISILNNNVLANSDFMTGAFPAEYGNALAGVFDIKMRNGNDEQHEFIGQLGFNGAELLAEGPFKKGGRASYLISYRYSTLEAFKAMGINLGTSGIPRYQDLSFKLNFPRKKGTTSIFGIGGISSIDILDSERSDEDVYGQSGEDARFGARVGAVGITHSAILSKKTLFKAVLSTNAAMSIIHTDTLSPQAPTPFPVYRNDSWNGKATLNAFTNTKFSSKSTLKVGAIVDRLMFHQIDSVYNRPMKNYVKLSDFDGSAYFVRPYTQWLYRFNNALSVTTGAYYQHFFYNNTHAIEPRAGMKYQLNEITSFSLGYGLHSQLQAVQVYFEQDYDENGDAFIPNKDIGMTKSHHIVGGFSRVLSEYMHFKTEAYYQHIFNAPVDVNSSPYSMLNQGSDFVINFPEEIENTGTGRNYGAEMTLEHFMKDGFYFLITGAYFESKYKGSDNIERNTIFNGNYALTGLGGIEFELNKKKAERKRVSVLFFDAKFTINGGQRYTPINLDASQAAGQAIYDYDQIYEMKYDDYMRLDVNIGFKLNGKHVTQEWLLYLQNATGRRNIFQQTYDPEAAALSYSYQLGFIPVIQYKIEF